MKNKKIIKILKYIILIFFFYLIFRKINLRIIFNSLKNNYEEYPKFIFSLLFFSLSLLIQLYLWRFILISNNIKVKTKKIFSKMIDALLLNTFIPGKIAIFFKGHNLTKNNTKIFNLIIFEFFLYFIALLSGSLWLIFYFYSTKIYCNLFLNILFFFIVNFFLIKLFIKLSSYLKKIINLIFKKNFELISIKNKNILIIVVYLFFIYHSLGIALYFLTIIFKPEFSLINSISGFYISQFSAFLSITPAGWGLKEYILINFLNKLNINNNISFLISMLSRFLSILTITVFFITKKIIFYVMENYAKKSIPLKSSRKNEKNHT